MNRYLRYISISHKTATIAQREDYQVSDGEKDNLAELICDTFPDITGLLLLITCNRTEIYFESERTSSKKLRDFFIRKKRTNKTKKCTKLFETSDMTEDSAKHLLEVSSGLMSSVLGDAEIIHQIKKAYQYSIRHQLMGSLLERALQAVFKSHKRISNETQFRDGTTSIAYKSLKVVCNTFDKLAVKNKRILFIGAGEIIKQLFKYNSKFNFSNIYISNRTKEKALVLADKHQYKIFDWNSVIEQKFDGFDVIISAVSNCHYLIKNIPITTQKVLLIDLAVPCNIDKLLSHNENIIVYDLDFFSNDVEATRERRSASISKVYKIISEELSIYIEWLNKASKREALSNCRILVDQKVKKYFNHNTAEKGHQILNTVTNRIMRELIKQPKAQLRPKNLDAFVAQYVSQFNS